MYTIHTVIVIIDHWTVSSRHPYCRCRIFDVRSGGPGRGNVKYTYEQRISACSLYLYRCFHSYYPSYQDTSEVSELLREYPTSVLS